MYILAALLAFIGISGAIVFEKIKDVAFFAVITIFAIIFATVKIVSDFLQ